MKSIFEKIKLLIVVLVLAVGANMVSAAYLARPNCTPPDCDAPSFLNTGANAQYRLGDLAIGGGTSDPSPNYAKLHVRGSMSTDSLIAENQFAVTGNLDFNNLYFKIGQSFNGTGVSTPRELCITNGKKVVLCN